MEWDRKKDNQTLNIFTLYFMSFFSFLEIIMHKWRAYRFDAIDRKRGILRQHLRCVSAAEMREMRYEM